MRYLLDSDVCVHLLRRGNESLKETIASIASDGLAISVITYGEVAEGVIYSTNRALNLQVWRDFVSGFDVLGVTVDVAEIWADVRGALRRKGATVPDNDLLIASTALLLDLIVVTVNLKHFGRVPGINILAPER